MSLIIDGILTQRLPWGLVLLGVLISVTLELTGIPSLPFAVGVYLPIQTSVPIFFGGVIRWGVDRLARQPAAEVETSPGILLSTGYIAGGTIAGVVVAFMAFLPPSWIRHIDLQKLGSWTQSDLTVGFAFAALVVILLLVGLGVFPRTRQPPPSPAVQR